MLFRSLLKATKSTPKETAPKQGQTTDKKAAVTANSGVIVEDIGSCLLKFARCCTPVPGDPIVGFVTKGYGVSIHRQDCPNAAEDIMHRAPERWVKAAWADAAADEPFDTSVEVDCRDRDGLLLDMAMVMSAMKVGISEIACRSVAGGMALASLTFRVKNVTELNAVCAKLRNVPGVEQVRRGKS